RRLDAPQAHDDRALDLVSVFDTLERIRPLRRLALAVFDARLRSHALDVVADGLAVFRLALRYGDDAGIRREPAKCKIERGAGDALLTRQRPKLALEGVEVVLSVRGGRQQQDSEEGKESHRPKHKRGPSFDEGPRSNDWHRATSARRRLTR